MAKVEGRTRDDELETVRRHRQAQAARGTGGTTSWFDGSFKVYDQHFFHTDKIMLICTFGELKSSLKTHTLKSQDCGPCLYINKL